MSFIKLQSTTFSKMGFETAAPEGKFHVVTWHEDLDCITPDPDSPESVGVFDSVEDAKLRIRERGFKPFSYTYIYDSAGKTVD